MLKEHPQARPNIYQVVKEVCAMRNRDCPIKDVRPLAALRDHALTIRRYTPTEPNRKHARTSSCRRLSPILDPQSEFPRLRLSSRSKFFQRSRL